MKSLVTASLCGVLLVSACSSDEPVPTGPDVIEMPVSKNALLVGGPVDDPGPERLTGKPTFFSGCLGATNGDKTYLVVWPSGTTVAGPDDDSLKIGDDVLEPGQSFAGHGELITRQPFPEQFPQIPLKCLAANQENIWWVHEIDKVSE